MQGASLEAIAVDQIRDKRPEAAVAAETENRYV